MARILIVEDEAPLREEVVAWLRYEGYEVLAASNGHEGIGIALASLPDLIVTDVLMPGMDGHAMLQVIRTNPTTALTPVVFLTARADRQDIRSAMNLGADDYLTKPFTRVELLNMIEARLRKHFGIKQAAALSLDNLRMNISHALPHELITPLTDILGAAELLHLEAEHLTAKQISSLAGSIVDSGNLLHRLVENYLLYVYLEVARTDPQQIDTLRQAWCFSAADLLGEVSRQLAIAYKREGDLQLTAESVTLNMSDTDYRKLVYELVDNAFKFSMPGTPVIVSQTARNDRVTLSVVDHGRGISAHQINHIGAFMQFERALYEQQGSGLGLSLVRQLVDLYDGWFDVKSSHHAGTEVTVGLRCLPHDGKSITSVVFP